MNVSIVIPIFNEVENIQRLYDELAETFCDTPSGIEFIFVDDGSSDGSVEVVKRLSTADNRVRLIGFRRNFGQTAAMQAGIERALGDVIVTMDGDLQNDPRDIPAMLRKLDEGYDLIHGWRKQRHDAWLSRKLPSRIANWLISRSTNVPVNDLGCTLKAMKSNIAKELKLYGQMHRFIPILASQRGARCYEMVTNHRARQFGESKYGISRTVQVILDLLTVKYLQSYFENPMKLFGKLGLSCIAVAALGFFATGVMKVIGGFDMTGNPLLLLSAFTFLASIQLFGLGLLGEVSARIFYETKENRPFAIDFDSNEQAADLKIYRDAA